MLTSSKSLNQNLINKFDAIVESIPQFILIYQDNLGLGQKENVLANLNKRFQNNKDKIQSSFA